MKIKTTMRYHFTPVRMSIINKQQVLERLWGIGNPGALLMGLQPGVTAMENSMEFLQKTETETAF